MRDRRRGRLSVALALSLGLVLAALVTPAGAAEADPDAVSRAGKQTLRIWAYFDGDTPVSGARVRVYADGRQLRERGGPGRVRTLSEGTALLRFRSLPSRLRIVASGGRAGGRPVRGSLKTRVRGVDDMELVHVNPVTTVADVWAHAEDERSHRRARNVVERTLGIKRVLNDYDLYTTDRWFNGDRFHRWTLEQGSVGAGARALVRRIERPGFDRYLFRSRDGEGPEARVAASGGADAASILNGLIDTASSAANLSGPQGFAVGALLLFVKKAIEGGSAASGQDEATAKLDKISDQITNLEADLGKKTLGLQAWFTERLIGSIETTEEDLRDALKHNANLKDKTLTKEKRQDEIRAFNSSTAEFIEAANALLKPPDPVAKNLHKALTNVQKGGTPEKPQEVPALLPGLREQIGRGRFLTSESGPRIRRFFSYYEWWQTRLAALLTEYYTLGGLCATTTPPDYCEKPPKPDPARARDRINEIKDNLAVQRQYLPRTYLDSEPLKAGQVFIDRTTKLMWGVEPEYRSSKDIMRDGTFSGCAVYSLSPIQPGLCQIDAREVTPAPFLIADRYDFRAATFAELNKLFADHTGDTLSWLKTAGVSFEDPRGTRFPGYEPNKLAYRVALWSRDGWWVEPRLNEMKARMAVLQYGTARPAFTTSGPLKDPDWLTPEIARRCPLDNHYRVPARPNCAEPLTSRGGFILWVRATSATEQQMYCGSGWDASPVLKLSTGEVRKPLSVPSLC
jgi:hypothetical protein